MVGIDKSNHNKTTAGGNENGLYHNRTKAGCKGHVVCWNMAGRPNGDANEATEVHNKERVAELHQEFQSSKLIKQRGFDTSPHS